MVRVRDGDGAKRVIVADDDEDSRVLVADALRAVGYDVWEASNGIELLAMLDDASLRPDVVVTDVKMPELSGLGVLHALQRARQTIPVVVMTGLSDSSIATFAMQLGAVGVLKKPFDQDDMLTAVGNAQLVYARRHPHE